MSECYRVLIAEDEETFARLTARALEARGHEVRVCGTGKSTLKTLAEAEWDVLLLDLKLPDARGIDLLAKVRQEHAEVQTIIVTGFANVETAIGAMRLGAFDYLTKPPNFEELAMRVEKAGEKACLERENRRLRYQVQRGLGPEILSRSPALKRVLVTLQKVAAARMPVLIEGESGVGKSCWPHICTGSRHAPRAPSSISTARPCPRRYSRASCLATSGGPSPAPAPRSRAWSRWRTAERSSSTRSARWRRSSNPSLLRVLDSGTFYRVGATRKRRADFRLVAATNRDLRAEVSAGRFRKDLFFRIHGVRVVVPLCASARRTSPCSWSILRAGFPMRGASLPRHWRRWRPMTGRQCARAAFRRRACKLDG